jgi:hypothetical protein
VGCWLLSIDQLQEAGVVLVHACVHSGVDLTQRRQHHVKQLCNLEALGVSTAIIRFLSVLTSRTTDEIGKVQVTTLAPSVNNWAPSPNLAAMGLAPPHHAQHKLRFVLQLVYVRVCVL